MTTSLVVTESIALNQTKAPALPFAPVEYDRVYQDTFNNILRQYFNTLDNFVSQLGISAGGSGAGLFLPYGSFADTTDQTALANTATVMTFNTTDFANGVSIVTSGGLASRFTVTNPGIYNFQWSGQFVNNDVQLHDASIWIRKNGSDVVGSTGFISIPNRHGGIDGHGIYGWNFLFNLAANDYIELWWSNTNTAISIQAYPVGTSPTRPSTSSLVATMTFVSAI